MEKALSTVYLTIKEFEKLSKERMEVVNFLTDGDRRTVYHDYYLNGGQVFLKPEREGSWT